MAAFAHQAGIIHIILCHLILGDLRGDTLLCPKLDKFINIFLTVRISIGIYHSCAGDIIISFVRSYFLSRSNNDQIRDSFLKGPGYVGSIAGYATVGSSGKAIIAGCSADETVSLYGESVGGIVGGGGKGISLSYCYFTGKILYATPSRANGLIGDIWIKDQECVQCYSIGYPSYRSTPDQVDAVYGTVESDRTKVLTEKRMTGFGARKHMPDLDWTVWYAQNGKTPQLKVVPLEKTIVPTCEGKKGEVWSGFLATKYAGGSGTENDPYLIETPEQLALLVSKNYANGGYYKLTADIYINETDKVDWATGTAKEGYKINSWFYC